MEWTPLLRREGLRAHPCQDDALRVNEPGGDKVTAIKPRHFEEHTKTPSLPLGNGRRSMPAARCIAVHTGQCQLVRHKAGVNLEGPGDDVNPLAGAATQKE